jgi:hypothetical protein
VGRSGVIAYRARSWAGTRLPARRPNVRCLTSRKGSRNSIPSVAYAQRFARRREPAFECPTRRRCAC